MWDDMYMYNICFYLITKILEDLTYHFQQSQTNLFFFPNPHQNKWMYSCVHQLGLPDSST